MYLTNVPQSVADTKHEHSFNWKATSLLFRRVEGAAAWGKLMQGTDLDGFRMRLKTYHNTVVLGCAGRTETYVQLHDKMLTNYGSFLNN